MSSVTLERTQWQKEAWDRIGTAEICIIVTQGNYIIYTARDLYWIYRVHPGTSLSGTAQAAVQLPVQLLPCHLS